MRNSLVNYLRAQRKRAGLSQREVALLLGYSRPDVVSKHELFESVPPLMVALAYQAIFQVSISELFAGLRDTADSAVEKQFAEFENNLTHQIGQGDPKPAATLLRKLEWLKERRLHSV